MKPLAALLPSKQTMRRIETAARIMAEDATRVDYVHTVQCHCGLPYRNPGDRVRVWEKKQGMASLRIEAGAALDPATGDFKEVGLPYGEKPRLVLIHLASEAIRTGNPRVEVGASLTGFARDLGLDTNGPSLRLLKDQLTRLSSATVRFGTVQDGRALQVNAQFVSEMELWLTKDDQQRVLWPSTVTLSDAYFKSLKRHAVPLDRRAIAALSSSAMALDVYVWLAQRLHRIPARQPQTLGWTVLADQFGSGFARLRDFRRAFLHVLKQVQAAYPQAKWDVTRQGVTFHQSRPPVARTLGQVPAPFGDIS